MDYHKSRFEDFSLMVFKEDKLIAVLPANIKGDTLYSHQGLSYGGLVLEAEVTFATVLNAFKAILEFIENRGCEYLNIKLVPKFYNKFPSDEIFYLLFKLHSELYRRDVSSVIDLSQHLNMTSSNRKRGLKRAIKNGLVVKEVNEFETYWKQILIPNLKERYNATPVHSVEEIELLKRRFPKNVRQFNVYHKSEIVAGCTIFETDLVVHVQYIAANSKRQELGSLDVLFNELITKTFEKKAYFDFGISNESDGQFINEGLLQWKSSFGGKTMVHDFYKVNVANRKLLDSVFI